MKYGIFIALLLGVVVFFWPQPPKVGTFASLGYTQTSAFDQDQALAMDAARSLIKGPFQQQRWRNPITGNFGIFAKEAEMGKDYCQTLVQQVSLHNTLHANRIPVCWTHHRWHVPLQWETARLQRTTP